MKTRCGAAALLVGLIVFDIGAQIAAWTLLPFMLALIAVIGATAVFLYLLRELQARWRANGWV